MTRKTWSPDEVNELRELWGDKTIPQIAKRLCRSNASITLKAKRLRLGNFQDGGKYLFARQVSYLLGIDVHTVCDYWVRKLGLRCRFIAPRGDRKFMAIDHEDLLRWLQKHQDLWDSRRVELYALGYEPEWLAEKRKRDVLAPERKNLKWTSTDDQILLRLLKNQNLTYKQIGQKLGRSENGIQRRIARIIAKKRCTV